MKQKISFFISHKRITIIWYKQLLFDDKYSIKLLLSYTEKCFEYFIELIPLDLRMEKNELVYIDSTHIFAGINLDIAVSVKICLIHGWLFDFVITFLLVSYLFYQLLFQFIWELAI